ncbi:hypothetical protein PVAND_009976 [Polypedilum vanderplanki]|uniref:CRAL-TRIO domain-containing protein n=1 Tax=Polypedilum vanderplanki TaxID=319348 RepID=A0A9J6CEF3_POLVA|nr:hypothetical protein PVAND_009976 [Polypedilum vanderplanki]
MSMTEQLFKTYEKELTEFEDWVKDHPRLPNRFNKLLLLRFLKVYDFDIEAAKKLLILNLETRKKYPHIFHNRDLFSDEIQTAMSTLRCCTLPKNTKENHKITVFHLADPDPNNFSYVDIVRMILASLDTRLIYCDPNELIDGEISIVDVSGFSFRHFTKTISHIGTMKAYLSYAQEAAPIKIIQTHFINCPPIINKLIAIIKPFMTKEVWESLKVHSTLESLYEHVSPDLLPIELGGTACSFDEIYKLTKAGIESQRDYVLCDDNWKILD